MCGRSQEHPWVSAASFLSWVGHRTFLPLDGLQDRQMPDLPAILFWLSFFLPLNPLEKDAEVGPNQPQPTKPLQECCYRSASHKQVPSVADCCSKASWLWRKFCLEDADAITCFSFAQRICSALRTCMESWHSSFLGTRVSASVLLTC